jgi:hypothetical protein
MKIRLLPHRTRAGWLALLAIPLAVVAAEGLGGWWMRPADAQGGVQLLEYDFPGGRGGCVARPLAEQVANMLHCDRGQTGSIQVGASRMIDVNYFAWDNTHATGLAGAAGHAPENCMGRAGMQVEQFLPNRTYRLGSTDLVFDATLFRDSSGAPLYIFKYSWAEGLDGVDLLRAGSKGGLLQNSRFEAVAERWQSRYARASMVVKAVARRLRPRHARVMMLGVYGAANEEEAWKLARLYVLEDLRFVNRPRNP